MAFSHSHFVWNELLHMQNKKFKGKSKVERRHMGCLPFVKMIPVLQKEYPQLKDVDYAALKQIAKALERAFWQYFNGKADYPAFRTKTIDGERDYVVRVQKGNVRLNNTRTYIYLAKVGWVKCRGDIPANMNKRMRLATIKQTKSGDYYITLQTAEKTKDLPKTNKAVGIDLGVIDLAVTSDGNTYPSQRLDATFYRKLEYWQKRAARREQEASENKVALKNAKNYQRAKRQVARIEEKIANKQEDYIHKITNDIIRKYDIIVLERLTIDGDEDKHLSREIAESSWVRFKKILSDKCDAYGKTLIFVNPYKTSQICSTCGYDAGRKPLNVRKWVCPHCHTTHDRDVNAAKNILALGLERALVK